MVPGVRSSGGDSEGKFDVDSPSGVVAVLAAIRAADVTQTQRNELRDLVFLFSRGGDEMVKSSLLAQLAHYKVTPVEVLSSSHSSPATVTQAETEVIEAAVVLPTEPKVVPTFFQSRPAPRFTAPVVVKSTPGVSPEPLNIPIYSPDKHDPVSGPIEPVLPIATTPVVSAVVTPVTPVSTPETLAETPVVPVEVLPQVGTADARTARIQEIKTAVNLAFGNPVNLVEIDNTLGREYMSALLEAMKLSAEADSATVVPVMERLETIFRLVEARVEMVGKDTQPKNTNDTAVYFQGADVPVISEPVIDTTTIALDPVPAPAVSRIVPIPMRMRVASESIPTTVPPAPDMSALAYVTVPTSTADVTPIVTVKSTSEAKELPTATPTLQSVAQTPVLKTLADLPTADALERSSVEGDPLFTKDVDDGMDQLLSEWSLFKKSGLFGTGPKGHLHPLFIKLASLQIPLIISGRFEGSSEEIKQSISDYMNGWRYEQGIIFENNETFEHYLRRVIRHIIDLQKKRRGS